MEYIPYHLRYNIYIQTMILKKNESGWKKIHDELLSFPLYLKKTDFIYDEELLFHYVLRASRMLIFLNGKKYTWLRKMRENPLIYYYKPIQDYCIYSIQDLFSPHYYCEVIDRDFVFH